MVRCHNLSPALVAQAQRTEQVARAAGLDFFEVVFESLDARDVNAVAAYTGFPLRYASWRFGMEFERLQKGYEYGLSKIYELVINNDPTVAYLVRSNAFMEQKLVMAHVFGHADFFKHNMWFGPTDRHAMDSMARRAERVRVLMDEHGVDAVERELDRLLSLDTLVDPYGPLRDHLRGPRGATPPAGMADRARATLEAMMDGRPEAPAAPRRQHPAPTYDVLGFLAEHAPLEPWQRELLQVVREEALYFLPQRMTKIMNEGWASFWHSRLLTGGLLDSSEIVEFADCHAGATAAGPGQLNPYKLGIELFRHAERQGHDLFRLRRVHNDVSFLDELVDAEFAAENQLFTYRTNARTGRAEVSGRDWRQIKQSLLRDLSWCGQPRIQLAEVDPEGALVLVHQHDGRDLRLAEASELLQRLAALWRAPVHLLTLVEGSGRRTTVADDEVTTVESKAAEERCRAGDAGGDGADGRAAG